MKKPLYINSRKRWVVKVQQLDENEKVIKEWYSDYFGSEKKASKFALGFNYHKGWNAYKVDLKPRGI